VATDALERCQSVSDYFRSLAEKRRDDKMGKSINAIGLERVSSDLLKLAQELRKAVCEER